MSKALRNHLHFIIIVPLLIIVMTWPTFVHVFDTDGFWLPTGRNDIYMLFRDAWYGKLVASGLADFYYTDLLFHPTGVSLAYHNFSLPHMLLLGALQMIMPASNAFNLTYLLLIFVTALSGYVYLQYLFKDRWIALFGTIVFGTSAFVLGRPATPHISFIATLPLVMYFLHRAIFEDRWDFILISAVLTGFTAFTGMYTLVCLLITLSLYILYFAGTRWRVGSFWRKISILLILAGAICAVRVYPMVADSRAWPVPYRNTLMIPIPERTCWAILSIMSIRLLDQS